MSENTRARNPRACCGVSRRFLLACLVLASGATQAQAPWTLERSIRQVLEVAPEAESAQAGVAAAEGALSQSLVWPNPEFELRGDDRLGKDDGQGGTDLTQFVFSQPLPLSGRLGHQRRMAQAVLKRARAERRYRLLLLEAETARRFHALQLANARLRLARQRLELADDLQHAGQRRARAGEMARLERLRLDLIREAAQQNLAKAEGRFNEALSRFRAYLGLPAGFVPELVPLTPFESMPPLAELLAGLPDHPALQVEQYGLEASRAGIDLARSERWPDPVLRLFREQDYLGGRRQEVNGVGVAVTVPLWDRKQGRIREAHAEMDRAEARLRARERDLGSRLRQAHLHLTHLVEQGVHFRERVYAPAREVFEMTRRAYDSGEVEILYLIDANNTYFDAHERYLELLQEAWLEAAELRLAAGRSLLMTTKQDAAP